MIWSVNHHTSTDSTQPPILQLVSQPIKAKLRSRLQPGYLIDIDTVIMKYALQLASLYRTIELDQDTTIQIPLYLAHVYIANPALFYDILKPAFI